MWRENRDGQSCGKNLVFLHSLRASFGDIHGVSLIVLWYRYKLRALQSIMGKGAMVTWPLKSWYFGSGRCKRGSIKIEGSIEEIFGR